MLPFCNLRAPPLPTIDTEPLQHLESTIASSPCVLKHRRSKVIPLALYVFDYHAYNSAGVLHNFIILGLESVLRLFPALIVRVAYVCTTVGPPP